MSGRRRRHRHRHRPGYRRRVDPSSAAEVDEGLCRWIDYCGGRMFVVGYTEGGAPYGHVEWPSRVFIDGDGAPRERDEDAEPF